MGRDNVTAYLAYGLHIPVDLYAHDGRTPGEVVDEALSAPGMKIWCPDVGHLGSGAYDPGSFFLVTACESADLGTHTKVDVTGSEHLEGGWDRQLTYLLACLGWHHMYELEPPGWFIVADIC